MTRRKPNGFLHALALAIRYDVSKRTQRRRIGKILAAVSPRSDRAGTRRNSDEMPLYLRDSVVDLVQSQLQVEQQIVLLEPFQRLFRYWHLLHLPLAGVMVLILLVHVAVAVLFGYTWVF
jgi:Flp pilus assembly protein TadB